MTFVLRNQVKEQRANTKADKNLQKQAKKADPTHSSFDIKTSKGENAQKPSTFDTQSLESDNANDAQRSLYRMTIDFRQINAVTTNQKTSQLSSIQAMEVNFQHAFVSTIDLANCYPSIEIKESSRDYFNFYVVNKIWHHFG